MPNETENWTREYYDDFGDVYETVWNEQVHTGKFENNEDLKTATERMNSFLADLVEVKPESEILNIGSGRGGADRFLAQKYSARIIGLDLSQKQINLARQRIPENESHNINYVQGSMTSLPFSKSNFDILWIQESFFHCTDKTQAMAEFKRVLKPGGKIIMEDTVLGSKEAELEVVEVFGKRVNVSKLLTAEEYETLAKQTGLVPIKKLDLTKNLEKTYQTIAEHIKKNFQEIRTKIPQKYQEKLVSYFGFPESERLAREGKLACYAFVFQKPANS